MTGNFPIFLSFPSKGSSHADLGWNAFPATCCQFLNKELEFRSGTRDFYVLIINWTSTGDYPCVWSRIVPGSIMPSQHPSLRMWLLSGIVAAFYASNVIAIKDAPDDFDALKYVDPLIGTANGGLC